MKIEITQYGHKSTYEFEHEDVDLEELLFYIERVIRLTGYEFNGHLEIVTLDGYFVIEKVYHI